MWLKRLTYLACWLIAILGWLVVAILMRTTALSVGVAVGVNHWVLGLIDKSTIVLAVLGWLLLAMVIESYYRNGVDRGELISRAARMTAVQLGIIALLAMAMFICQQSG
jgi:hypothetical protein